MHSLDGIQGRYRVVQANRDHPRVVRVVNSHGEHFVVKIGKTPATARREAMALKTLNQRGAPVPKVLEHDDARGVLVLSYIPGPTWGEIPADDYLALLPAFMADYRTLCQSWQESVSELSNQAFPSSSEQFAQIMRGLESQLCSLAPYKAAARDAWRQLVDLAMSAPRTFGSLDYNPFNVIHSPIGFRFVDFESYGEDWEQRRLLQYTTQIRRLDGHGGWHPALLCWLSADPFLEAHYVLFSAMAWARRGNELGLTIPAIWDYAGGHHQAMHAWREAWGLENN